MTKAKRLAALEVDTISAWRSAWEQSAVTFERHLRGLNIDTADLLRRLERERPGITADDVEQESRAFLKDIGITAFDEFAAWFKSYKLPDLDRPDLAVWPSDIPTPPAEVSGSFEIIKPFQSCDDAVQRIAAQVYLFLLAAARAVRDDKVQ
jgi:hypothetical protein